MKLKHYAGLAVIAATIAFAGTAFAAGMVATTGGCAQNTCEAPPKIILTSVVGG